MGQGKGNIDHFVARVPAGRVMFNVPTLPSWEGRGTDFYWAFLSGHKMPMSTRFRLQTNYFKSDRPCKAQVDAFQKAQSAAKSIEK